jgi:SEL1 protein
VSRDGKKVNHERVMVDGVEKSIITPVEEDDNAKNKEKHFSSKSEQAREILRSIRRPATSKLAKFVQNPQGIVGSLVYYAKEIFVFLFMNTPDQDSRPQADDTAKLDKPLADAVQLLEDGVREGDPDAMYLLADMNFYGNHTHPINYDDAFSHYKELADLTGNATAQYMLAFIYATGLAPSVPSDQAKSMLYHTFAAEGGNTRSQMTLAYRQIAGIASPRNCDEGVGWYKLVADKAIAYYRSGPPGGHSLPREAYRIADETGGVFGEGASVASAGPNARQGGPTSDAYANVEDVLEYLHLQSGKGDIKATFGLARLHYDGARGMKRDYKLAKGYFLEVAREYWPNSSNKVRKDVPAGTEKLASKAAGYLGRMFLRGEGMAQSFPIAQKWFTRGISNGDALSQYSMGLMHLYGFGVEQDTMRAADFLSAAADQDLAVAQTELGKLFLDQGDIITASKYFELAIRNNHIEALWYLAEMYEKGVGRDRSCGVAAAYYKIVAEKAEVIWSSLAEASAAYEDGDMQKAIIGYLMAAEQGNENSQANVAWLLDQTTPRWSPLTLLGKGVKKSGKMFGDTALALIHWTRSARQQNVDSLVKMGDYYLSGSGGNAENAAACYQAAAESLQSAQAMWNLGWMHENGIGISQDFHLAKRFYDQALETNPQEAYLTVQLSLFKLRWRSWWNGVGPEEDEEGKKKGKRSLAEWLVDFLEADAAQYYEADDWEGQGEGMPGGDYEYAEGEDDGMVELVLIGSLVAALGWLFWYRQQQRAVEATRRAERERAEELERNGGQMGLPPQRVPLAGAEPGDDRGMFPQPGQPGYQDWLAGGVGH